MRAVVTLFFLLTVFRALSSTNSEWFTRVWQIDDGLIDNDINGIIQGPGQVFMARYAGGRDAL